MLMVRLSEFNATAVPPGNLPIDERGNPKYFDYVFTNFGDYEQGIETNDLISNDNSINAATTE